MDEEYSSGLINGWDLYTLPVEIFDLSDEDQQFFIFVYTPDSEYPIEKYRKVCRLTKSEFLEANKLEFNEEEMERI